MGCRKKLAIAWAGLPHYAARLLRPVAAEHEVSVLGTPGPQSPTQIVGDLGQGVTWVGGSARPSWRDLGLSVPEYFFVSGWSDRRFNTLAQEARQAGASVVLMADNSRNYSFRQRSGSLAFRVWWRDRFDFAFVPGAAARELLQYYGMSSSRISIGLYGADSGVFTPGPPLESRERDFIFVGQFIARKGLSELIESVTSLRREGATFSIAALGAGKMEADLRRAGISVLPFGDASFVAEQLRKSRFLVLPSREDHWGVVVHEAVCSGCALALSEGVGAARDVLSVENGFIYHSYDVTALTAALSAALRLSPKRLAGFGESSLKVAGRFGPKRFVEAVNDIVLRGGEGSAAVTAEPLGQCSSPEVHTGQSGTNRRRSAF